MTVDTAFKLSRIYAEGWNAANKLEADEAAGLDPERMTAMNPYVTASERARWNEGFAKALGK